MNVMKLFDRDNNDNFGVKLVYESSGTEGTALAVDNTGLVGINTTSPDTQLHVAGQIKIDDGSNPYTFPAADGSPNQVLQTDGDGAISFATISSGASDTTDLGDVSNTAADADGEILIWSNTDSRFAPNTLTAGTGISITNAASSVTISSTATSDNIYNTNGTLTGNRDVDLDGNTLSFVSDDGTDAMTIDNNGNIAIRGTTSLNKRLTVSGTNFGGVVGLREASANGTDFVALQAPTALAASYNLVLPTSDGDADQVLKTNGSGSLGWVDQPTGVPSAYTLPASDGTDGQVLGTDGNGTISFVDNDNIYTADGTIPSGAQRKIKFGGGGSFRWTDSTGSTTLASISSQGRVTSRDIVTVETTPGSAGGAFLNLKSSDASNFGVTLKAAVGMTSSVSFILPTSGGSTGQVLSNSGGAGNPLAFVDQTTLANSDMTLTGDRTIDLDGNALLFENSSTEIARLFSNGYFRAKSRVIVGGSGTDGGQVRLFDSDTTNFISLKAPATLSSDVNFTLPASDGDSGHFLKTDGSGNLSFAAASGGGGSDTVKHFYSGGAQLQYSFSRYLLLLVMLLR